MFISASQNSCSATDLHETTKVRYPFITFKGSFLRHIFAALLPVACIALLPNTSFAQATLTDDHSQFGPKDPNLYLGNNGGSSATTFLKFNLSGAPVESNVSRATLKLFVNPISPGNPNQGGQYQIDVRDISNAWSEQSPTPQNNGTLLATASVSLPSYSNFITIDITNLVRDWINGIRPNNGVALGIRSGPRNYLVLDGKENTLTSQLPKLELVLDKITGVTTTAGLSGGGTTGNIAVGISDGGVTTPRLADGAVTSQKIVSGAVGTSQLALGGVTSANIAAGSIGTQHLTDGSVTSLKIATGAVGTPQLAAGAVTSSSIAAGVVGNQHLADGSVTSSKIGPAAVGTPQLAAGAVTSTNIEAGAVGGAQLANGVVNTTHLADSAVTSAKIASGQTVKGLNGLTDNVTLAAGDNVTIVPSGSTLTISATGPKLNSQQIALLRWYDVNKTASFQVGNSPVAIAFDGANIWVSNHGDNTVTKLRASDGSNLGTFAVGPNPSTVAFDGANIWVANYGGSTVTKLRASDGALIDTITVGSNPRGLSFDGANLWVSNYGSGTITKLRANDGVILGTTNGVSVPAGMAYDGSNIWVARDLGFGSVTKVRASDGVVLDTFSTSAGFPREVAFDGANIWVTNHFSVTKLRASDGALLGVIDLGFNLGDIAFDGANMWVANESHLFKLRASDGALIGQFPFPVANSWFGVAFDGANIWVANFGGNTVIKQ